MSSVAQSSGGGGGGGAVVQAPAGHSGPRWASREMILLLCVLSLLLLLSFTAFVSRMYHKKVHVLADQWFDAGERQLQAGDSAAALTDYRNALVYSPTTQNFNFISRRRWLLAAITIRRGRTCWCCYRNRREAAK